MQIKTNNRAESVLAEYKKARGGAVNRAADRAIYEAQLEAVAENERGSSITSQEVLGVFLLIYLNTEKISDDWSSVVRSIFSLNWMLADSAHNDRENSGSKLSKAIGKEEFLLEPAQELVTVAKLGLAIETPLSPERYILASEESMQAAYFKFRFESLMMNENKHAFFTNAQREKLSVNNFFLSLLDVKARAEATDIIKGNASDIAIIKMFLTIAENSITYNADIGVAAFEIFPELKSLSHDDNLFITKIVCFLTLNFICSILNIRCNSNQLPEVLLPMKKMFTKMLSLFFDIKTDSSLSQAAYIHAKKLFDNADARLILTRGISLEIYNMYVNNTGIYDLNNELSPIADIPIKALIIMPKLQASAKERRWLEYFIEHQSEKGASLAP